MQSATESNDVLHNENHSQLTPEEIAKALAHHNHRHHGDQAQTSAQNTASGKKNK